MSSSHCHRILVYMMLDVYVHITPKLIASKTNVVISPTHTNLSETHHTTKLTAN